ncbi:long-chain acyl-CoA synthetase [Haloactinospora alba]|uniref:Long-chain acyl-CoA synthetase n=1 Tax=Haloactinospora alba TaxID=405555 RepID=A0A543NJC4_9ACTN|nr:long-chain fatty acid--CoA ligase [Haloactinospora alba]TQN31965.1 long-chain acyl-CoA synthetase [Haloactinospora alba]
MQHISAPEASVDPDPRGLAETLFDRAARDPDRPMLSIPDSGGWRDISAARTRDWVASAAKGLMACGVTEGQRVALLSGNRYEWTVLDYAVWAAGAVSVPIYPSSSAEQIAMILRDSGAVACFVDDETRAATVRDLQDQLPDLGRVWTIDRGALDELDGAGAGVTDAELAQRRSGVASGEPATIVYTSGTTGTPKGCVLTHANFRAEVDSVVQELSVLFRPQPDGSTPSTLLFLPLAHVFGRMVQIGVVQAGAKLGHTGSVRSLIADLATFRPSFLLAVPYVVEKVHSSARNRTSGLRRRIFDRAEAVAVAYSRSLDRSGPRPWLRAARAVFEPLVYRQLRNALGGRCGSIISGGGALDERLLHFYRGVGLDVYEGYGLTETTAAVVANVPGRVRPGTIGTPLPGAAVRIADDGEILVSGPHVFDRYWNRPEATEAAFTDGWFATGDLGELDSEGYIRVTGRKKEILVTAGGKNVTPAPIEERVCVDPLVDQCMLVGDGKPFVAALVSLAPEEFSAWKRENGYPEEYGVADLATDPRLRAAVQRAVDDANTTVSRAEAIREFTLIDPGFSVAEETLTPTLKLRRTRILERYADEIAGMYERR